MEITWLGNSSVRLVSDDIALALDPHPQIVGADAHVVAISCDDPARSAADAIGGVGDVAPRVLDGPGMYEALGYNITGVGTPRDADTDSRRVNTVYLIRAGGVTVCALGSLGRKLTSRQLAALGAVDALITEVRPDGPLSPREVAQMINVLGARVIVPLEPAQPENGDETAPESQIDALLSHMHMERPDAVLRVNVTPNNLPREARVVVLR